MTKRALVVSLLHCTDQIGRTSLLHFCLTGASCAEVHSDRLLSPFPFDVEKGRRTVGSWVLIFPDQHGVHGIWVKDCINHDWKHFSIYGDWAIKGHILFKVPVYRMLQSTHCCLSALSTKCPLFLYLLFPHKLQRKTSYFKMGKDSCLLSKNK